ncbi:non-ribosomal peptide synthetase [Pseudoalteromonas sp. A25]|uniref:non-ribosomal peptide synthetase n=1 Tax=Pseudoalteromonas sp. A25 TaxID=116092 RepID=UPI001260D76F|nr:non-ribosomal peptide synthetase [Pseudoalteromonas sp. A25]BBN81580.1 non-ribosomal peptide synthetase [Pseudoalteromonas sp. A25]
MMNEQTLHIENLIGEALAAGITLYEKNGGLAFKQKADFPPELKSRIVANKDQIIAYFVQQKSVKCAETGLSQEIVPAVRPAKLPLSFAQEGLWFVEQLQGGEQYYMSATFKLIGDLDEAVFKQTIAQIVARHETLRTQFVADEHGVPQQVILPAITVPLRVVDAYQLEKSNKNNQQALLEKVSQLIEEFKNESLNLEVGPLFRVLLVKLETEYRLTFNMHHIISDGASLDCLMGEVETIYSGLLKDKLYKTQPLPIQYVDYALWQRQTLSEAYLRNALTALNDKLSDLEPILSLPTDRPRPSVQTNCGRIYRQQLDSAIINKLKQQVAQHQVTPFMWVLSCFMLFIGRISQTNHVAVGTPVLGRNHPSLNNQIGLYANTIVIPAELEDDSEFCQWLQKQKESILEAFEYDVVPFDKLVEALNCKRDLSHHPLVQILFTLEQTSRSSFELPNLTIEEITPLSSQQCAIKCDLELNVQLSNQSMVLNWKFDDALYDIETITHWADSFVLMLNTVCTNASTPCARIPLLKQNEIQKVLQQGQQYNDVQWPNTENLVTLFEHQVRQHPKRLAITDEHGSMSYHELNARANQIAHILISKGVRKEQLIPISVSRNADMIATLLAILKAGCAYVPIDPDYPADRIEYIVKDVGGELLVCDNTSVGVFNSFGMTVVNIHDFAKHDTPVDVDNPSVGLLPQDLAYMIYTSGTTGRPKGVQIEHRNVVRLLFTEPRLFDFDEQDVWTLFHSFCFDFSVWEMYGALLFGGRLVIVSKELSKDSVAFAKLLLEQKVTVLNQTPSAFYVLQDSMLKLNDVMRAQSCIRYVIFGGEALHCAKLLPWAEQFNDCKLINMYGITETTVHVTYKQITLNEIAQGASNIGTPIPTTTCYVLDKYLQPLPYGAIGELYVGGEGVCRGYWQKESLNQQRFITNPFCNDNSKLYKTGDLVRLLCNGELLYVGRIDDQVKVRGYRIELGEIENQLRTHPRLGEAVALLKQDKTLGASICAFVVLAAKATFDDLTSEVQEYLRKTLPEFMIPTKVIAVSKLHLTGNGKVDKKALLSLDSQELEMAPFSAPSSESERLIAACFAKVLNLEEVGRDDHFFRLGGHSLLAAQAVAQLRENAKLNITLKDLFQRPQVKSLAMLAKHNQHIENQPIDEIALKCREHNKATPLSFAQQRLWSIDKLQQGSFEYHMSSAFELSGELNIDAFTQAWYALMKRHEVLRTCIITSQRGEPYQQVQQDYEDIVHYVDATTLTKTQQQTLWLKILRDDRQTPFRLDQDVMLRVTLLKLGTNKYRLLVNMHHIASDAQSLTILVKEFTQFYHSYAFTHALPDTLRTPLPIQYRDYAIWQRGALTQQTLEEHGRFWLNMLDGAPPVHQLPLDKPRSKLLVTQGALYKQQFEKQLSAAIRAHCQRLDVTLFTWLHTAFSLAVARFSQTDDVVIGSPFSGRNHTQLEHLIGFFVNTLPIRTVIPEDVSFEALLVQQKHLLHDIHMHKEMPFEQIIERLQLNRDLSHQSVFQLTFSVNSNQQTALKLPALEAKPIDEHALSVKFDIELSCHENDDHMQFNWVYNKAVFDKQTTMSLANTFSVLVEQIVTHPNTPVRQLCLLTQSQAIQQVISGRYTEQTDTRTVIDEFIDRATSLQDKPVLIEPNNNESICYNQLHVRSSELAQYLINNGLKPEQRVVVSMAFSDNLLVAMLGILKAGGCYVPVDPNYPQQRIGFISEDCKAAFVITYHEHADKFSHVKNSSAPIICVDDCRTAKKISEQAQQKCTLPKVNAQQLAYVIYTSGTTGKPKGVMIPHRGLMNLCSWHNHTFQVSENSVASQTANIAFDAAAWEVWPYLCAGAKILAVPRPTLNAPIQFAELLSQYKVTHCFLATPIAEAILADEGFTPQYLNYLLVGGDRLNRVDVSALQFKVVNNYGPTEASVVTTSGLVTESKTQPDIGKPVDNTSLFILDKQRKPVPTGMIGELYIAGSGLARGYLNQDDLTASRFITLTTPANESVRAYQSGDLVRQLENGKIAYVGRVDNQIKLRGYRIELSEIEQVLGSCPEVNECVVQVCSLNGGAKQLVAFLCFDAKYHCETHIINIAKKRVSKALPSYMHPRHYVALNTVPLTPHGKIDHQALIREFKSLDEQSARQSVVHEQSDSSQTLEGKLLNLYHGVLNAKALRIDDDFFAFGGDSILSIQIASRARALGMQISVADVFNYNTVARLAEHLNEQNSTEDIDQPVPEHNGIIEPLPIQKWFFEQNFEQPTHWNQGILLSIDKSVSLSHIEAALENLIQLHDSLRQVVTHQGELFVKAVIAVHEVMKVVDVSSKQNWQSSLLHEANNAQSSFEFNAGPLLRVCFIKTPQAESDNRLLIIAHHLIIDGVSWRILLEDLQQACESISNGHQIALPKRTVSLKQVSQFYSELGQKNNELKRWQSHVKCAEAGTMLKLKALEAGQQANHITYKYTCLPELTGPLLKEANVTYNTSVQVLLLSALQWCAMQYYQTHSQIIMLEGHGREILNQSKKAQRSVGWFTAMYPFHLFSNAVSLHEVICTIKEQLADTSKVASSYGALRYSNQSRDIRQSLHIDTKDKIFFNYLGQLDNAIKSDGQFKDAFEDIGGLQSACNHLYYGLQITAAISDGALKLSFDYDSQRIDHNEVELLALNFEQSLKAVLTHCAHTAFRQYTPSDFALLSDISRLQLEKLVAPYSKKVISDIYPLSMLQKGMWLVSQRNSLCNDIPYLEQVSMVLSGEVDVEAFSYAWQRVIQTHSILRTAFVKGVDEPLQLVIEDIELPLQIDEQESFLLSDTSESDYLKGIAEREYRQGIDLTKAPCMRLRLLPFGEDRYGFIWTYHHLILDGWSLPTLFANLLAFYSARINAQYIQIREDHFKDYIAYLAEQNAATEQSFWHRYLSNVYEPTLVSEHIQCDNSDAPKPLMAQLDVALDIQQQSKLVSFAKTHGFTINHILQGVWGYWLSICCDKDYALFGQTISGRPSDLTHVEERVGLYINTQAVKLETHKNDDVLTFLNRVRQTHLQLSNFTHSALTNVHDWSGIDNSTALFDALYVFENYPTDPLDNVTDVPFTVQSQNYIDNTHYPLTLVAGDSDGLTLTLCYDLSVFSQKVAQHCLDTLCHLLKLFVTQPYEQLYKLPLIADPEVTAPIDTCSLGIGQKGFVDFDMSQSILERFEQMVAVYPDKIALKFYKQGEYAAMSYTQLNQRADQLAGHLSKALYKSLAHMPKQPIFAICLDKGFELIISVLACLKLGAAYLVISPQLPHERRLFITDNAGVIGLVSANNEWQGELPKTDYFDINAITHSSTADLKPYRQLITEQSLCYVIYTSGTTGTPKGVMIEQKSVLNYVAFLSRCYGITHTDNYLQFASSSFDVFAEEIFCSLLNGATLVMTDANQLLTARGLAKVSNDCSLTLMSLPTAYWHMLAMEKVNLSTQLRVITIGGEQMQRAALSAWQQHYGTSIRLINAYGPTEATISTTLKDVTNARDERVSIGLPVAGTHLAICDKYHRALPNYLSGELYISGVCLAKGYIADTQKTDSVFIYDRTSKTRWYKTGDKVRVNKDQEIEYLGRLDEQVKVRGYRIELGEIERSLLLNELVTQCAVVVRQDGNGLNQLVAFLVSNADDLELSTIRATLAQRLPDYMVPQYFEILDTLPFTNNGKIDRKSLVEKAQTIQTKLNYCEGEYLTPLQQALSDRLKALLKLKDISVRDDIFMLGAHSLLAMRLVGELSDELDIDLPIDIVFENKTIATLSQAVEKLTKESSTEPEEKTLLCLQKGQKDYKPIVLIAGAGGLLISYQSLVQGLDKRIPVFGLQPNEIADKDEVLSSVSLTASHYLSELDKLNTSGDIHIVAHSFGSFIAHEMVQQAKHKTHIKLSLTVLDTPVPTQVDKPTSDEQCNQIMLENIMAFFSVPLSEEQKCEYAGLNQAQKMGWASRILNASGYRFSISQLSCFSKVFSAQLNAPVALMPLFPLDTMEIIKANETNEFEGQLIKPSMGWDSLCNETTCYEVEGNHLSILKKPHVDAVVRILEKNYVLH